MDYQIMNKQQYYIINQDQRPLPTTYNEQAHCNETGDILVKTECKMKGFTPVTNVNFKRSQLEQFGFLFFNHKGYKVKVELTNDIADLKVYVMYTEQHASTLRTVVIDSAQFSDLTSVREFVRYTCDAAMPCSDIQADFDIVKDWIAGSIELLNYTAITMRRNATNKKPVKKSNEREVHNLIALELGHQRAKNYINGGGMFAAEYATGCINRRYWIERITIGADIVYKIRAVSGVLNQNRIISFHINFNDLETARTALNNYLMLDVSGSVVQRMRDMDRHTLTLYLSSATKPETHGVALMCKRLLSEMACKMEWF